jgi:hypothetical protein
LCHLRDRHWPDVEHRRTGGGELTGALNSVLPQRAGVGVSARRIAKHVGVGVGAVAFSYRHIDCVTSRGSNRARVGQCPAGANDTILVSSDLPFQNWLRRDAPKNGHYEQLWLDQPSTQVDPKEPVANGSFRAAKLIRL